MSKATIHFDDLYELNTYGLGCWFMSKESKLPIGTVRCIRGVLFQVTFQHGTWFKPYTTWTPANPKLNTVPNMKAFAAQIAEGRHTVTGLSPERK